MCRWLDVAMAKGMVSESRKLRSWLAPGFILTPCLSTDAYQYWAHKLLNARAEKPLPNCLCSTCRDDGSLSPINERLTSSRSVYPSAVAARDQAVWYSGSVSSNKPSISNTTAAGMPVFSDTSRTSLRGGVVFDTRLSAARLREIAPPPARRRGAQDVAEPCVRTPYCFGSVVCATTLSLNLLRRAKK